MSVKLEYSTTASCSPEAVWQQFRQTDRWPEWTTYIQGARWISGEPWQTGSEIELSVAQPPINLKGTLTESKPPFVFVIKGSAMGINVEHEFGFVEQNGRTLMATRMTLTGPATVFINAAIKDRAIAGFAQWFEQLRRDAEAAA